MGVAITYNGTTLQYPSTVSMTNDYIDYGGRWGSVQKISIQGSIVPGTCSNSLATQYANLISAQNTLFSLFQNDYGTLVVGSSTIKNCKLDNIDFQESNYYGAIGFTVTLTSYPSSYFVTAPVTDPVHLVTYSEQPNNSIQITYKVSAKGINTNTTPNTGSNALANARAYVNARINYSTALPALSQITNKSSYNLSSLSSPRKVVETIDRMNGSVSVEQIYILKAGQTSLSSMFYTIECAYDDEKGLSTGTIKGTVTGVISQTMASLRTEFASFSPFNKLNTYFQNMGYGALLNQPENMSVHENARAKTIEFSYTCNTMVDAVKSFEKVFNMSCEYATDKVVVNFSGKVDFRGGQAQRVAAAAAFTFTVAQAQSLCTQFYTANTSSTFGGDAILNIVPASFIIKRDLINGSVTISASFDNTRIPPNPNFTSFDYTLTANISVKYHSLIQFLDGGTSALDYKMKTRGDVSIQGTAKALVAGLEKTCLTVATNALQEAITAVGGLTSPLLTESKVEAATANNADDSGYVYTFIVTQTGITGITADQFGTGGG